MRGRERCSVFGGRCLGELRARRTPGLHRGRTGRAERVPPGSSAVPGPAFWKSRGSSSFQFPISNFGSAFSCRFSEAFTLIELLVVIGIIAILAALLLPAINATLKKGEVNQARADVRSLVTAWKAYFTEYARWPVGANDRLFQGTGIFQAEQDAGERGSMHNESTGIIMNVWVMTNVMYPNASLYGGTTYDNASQICISNNPKKLQFMEYKGDAVDSRGSFVDPWGRPYRVMFDLNRDGKVERGPSSGVETTIYDTVIAWSVGPDGYISADDVTSWE